MAWIVIRPAPAEPLPGIEYRGEGAVVKPLVAEGEALPADAFALAWAPVEEGASYDVRVSTVGGDVLVVRRGLRETSVTVPQAALA